MEAILRAARDLGALDHRAEILVDEDRPVVDESVTLPADDAASYANACCSPAGSRAGARGSGDDRT